MKKIRSSLAICLLLAMGFPALHSVANHKKRDPGPSSDRPMIAVWCNDQGWLSAGAPGLRIAVWEDGRICFASDPKVWGHKVRQGWISPAQVADLKKRVDETGVFNLKGACYLVPDAPVDCVMVAFGVKRQMLYWDESESPSYGINIHPTPTHLKFKECWKAVNRIVLASRPERAAQVKGPFRQVPKLWYLKPSIESE